MRSPSPKRGPPPRVLAPGRHIPTTSGCKNHQGLSRWKKLLAPQAVPLKAPTKTHLLRFTPYELWQQGGGLRGTSSMQGEAEVSGIKVSRCHCPFSKPSPCPRVSKLVPYLRFHQPNPAYTVCPTLEIPRDPAPHNLQAHPSCCSL